MKGMRDEYGTTFIFSTHDPKIMGEAEVTFTLEDGRMQTLNGGSRPPDMRIGSEASHG